MNIKLKSTKVTSLMLEGNEETESGDFEFSYSQGYSEDKDKEFTIRFESVIGLEEGVKLEIVFDADFVCDERISEKFKDSHFPSVNAPAIAFPYLRVFISNFSLNSGYDTVILPAINFQALAKKKAEKNKNKKEKV